MQENSNRGRRKDQLPAGSKRPRSKSGNVAKNDKRPKLSENSKSRSFSRTHAQPAAERDTMLCSGSIEISFGLPSNTDGTAASWPLAEILVYDKEGNKTTIAEDIVLTGSPALDQILAEPCLGPKRLLVDMYLEGGLPSQVFHRDIELCFDALKPAILHYEFGFVSEIDLDPPEGEFIDASMRNALLLRMFTQFAERAGFVGHARQDLENGFAKGPNLQIATFTPRQ